MLRQAGTNSFRTKAAASRSISDKELMPPSTCSRCDTLEVTGQGEVRLRGHRERLGGRQVPVAVHLRQERQSLADHPLVDLMGEQLPALDELVQAEAVLRVPGQRLGQHAQATLPSEAQNEYSAPSRSLRSSGSWK